MLEVCADAWRNRCSKSPFRDAVTFDDDCLVLGHGTILYKMMPSSSALISLRTDDLAHDRAVALLSVAGGGRLAKTALAQLVAAVDDWRSGDRGLAAIRLVFARLPRLRDPRDAHRLFLAETAIDAGVSPRTIVEELSYLDCVALLKFEPNQPRVPAGSGVDSGRWTSEAAGGSAGSKPTTGGARTPKPTPIFLPSAPEDADESDTKETQREFGLPDFDAERSGQRLHFPEVFGIPSSPGVPSRTPLTAPATEPALNTIPSGSGGLSGADPASSNNNDKGPACPAPQNDRPNGPNSSGDEFEYRMSLLINPNSPTPKNSLATPTVTSQAYYLASPTPDGKSAFDDCKKDDTPTVLSIPNLEPGDMFEHKAAGWSGLLSNSKTAGYRSFESQIRSQSAAVVIEGRGRQIYYCMGDQSAASTAANAFQKYPNTHFLVCH